MWTVLQKKYPLLRVTPVTYCCKQWPKQELQRVSSAEETHRYVVGFQTAAKQGGYRTPIATPCSAGADGQSGHPPQFNNLKLQVRLYSSPPHWSSVLPICLHLQKRKYLVPELHLRFHWTRRLHCRVNPNPFEVNGSFVTGENKARYLTSLW